MSKTHKEKKKVLLYSTGNYIYYPVINHTRASLVAQMVKESSHNAGDLGSIPGLGRSPGGTGNRLQYSCLGNPMDRGAWWATVHGITKSPTQLSD